MVTLKAFTILGLVALASCASVSPETTPSQVEVTTSMLAQEETNLKSNTGKKIVQLTVEEKAKLLGSQLEKGILLKEDIDGAKYFLVWNPETTDGPLIIMETADGKIAELGPTPTGIQTRKKRQLSVNFQNGILNAILKKNGIQLGGSTDFNRNHVLFGGYDKVLRNGNTISAGATYNAGNGQYEVGANYQTKKHNINLGLNNDGVTFRWNFNFDKRR